MKDLQKFMTELEDEVRFKLAIAKTCGVSPTMIRKETGGKSNIDKRIENMTLIPEYIFAMDRAIKTMKKMSIIKQDSSIIAMKWAYGNRTKVRYTGANITEHGATGEKPFPTRK